MWATSDGSISLCRSDAARCFSKNSLSAPASLTSGLVDIFRKNSTLPSERVGTALEIKSFDAHDGQGLRGPPAFARAALRAAKALHSCVAPMK